ncbi:MAG TPA: bifunctional proline dehydrogenase/L-glutamate gamma-semialdehyde dehydrogenase PutA [Burkholderiaceae bacterium]|nr:bifunctional proline dehydrogenase/L-glutamate gamma-semialdehyde dehydrogenase PutA [Burkholderiaceae bacterium]
MDLEEENVILNDLPSVPSLAAVRAHTRPAETESVANVLRHVPLSPQRWQAAQRQARVWISALRGQRSRGSGVDALMREFSLSSQEGVALMCLAEALARIPDRATADALIRDKLAQGDWRAHIGTSRSIFVNAAAWGLMVTGGLVATHSDAGLSAAVSRMIARGGEPLIRAGVDIAMRLLGQQFVLGRTIEQALARARDGQTRGYHYSYDMLGEAALTAGDAQRYFASYAHAIDAVGASISGAAASAGADLSARPGISVKLSALHPRFTSFQRERVLAELLPRLQELCRLARASGIGFNIDAEESERLEITLELFARLANDPGLSDWEGLGIVVQAYQKRALPLVDWLAQAAAQSRRRITVRLVKGAYWDSEIKRAQTEGQADFPVYTRKVHTDAAYLACAARLLAHGDRIFAQFATHNALTVAAVLQLVEATRVSRFELQCLHGMGETLYDMLVGPDQLNLACRIYAPVGSHDTLLAYLVRRLLENGANSSFVNRVVDDSVAIDELLEDPFVACTRSGGRPHPAIALPADLYLPGRRNSAGIDLHDERSIEELNASFHAAATHAWTAYPILASDRFDPDQDNPQPICNPARRTQIVGTVQPASERDVQSALATAHADVWSKMPAASRALVLEAVADAFQTRRDDLMWLAVCEAGKSLPDAAAEVREAIDFCRYYAQQARALRPGRDEPVGLVVAISPWNFPLAIFTGQISAALAAGNPVLAKPAEQTPLIAALAVRLMHAAGVPRATLQLLPGDGAVGAMLTADARVRAVLFTGSTEVAALIDRALANSPAGAETLLVAETGGQNAMIVDSSAQPEQVVQDVLTSAFNSAGQRCSALRILCLQEEIADSILEMLVGSAAELRVGDPIERRTDLGPVIDETARQAIEGHIAGVAEAKLLARAPLSPQCADGTFVAPAVVQISAIDELQREVFGPVLHVLRYRREQLPELIDAINATGYALTCGIHSRIDETIEFIASRIRAGNVYVNRNMIGAVVGVQPFGGQGLSGTGPKAGGPWTVQRLRRAPTLLPIAPKGLGAKRIAPPPTALSDLESWLLQHGDETLLRICRAYAIETPIGCRFDLPGPTGESNLLQYRQRGRVLCLSAGGNVELPALLCQLAAVVATANRAMMPEDVALRAALDALPQSVNDCVDWTADWRVQAFDVVLLAGNEESAHALRRELAQRSGARVALLRPVEGRYALDRLVAEQVVTTNTAAAGGNATLMSLQPV